ncbi:TIGR04139 family peptide modification target [Chryseobacterium sp.]|uniref:TIGR04139 family peptide modification target n=1 Tax=Chryseobacterium sp. TaxID=1871047 RepID=UPI002FCA9EC0
MKKIKGMKKNFSSLENKKLSKPSSIVGGLAGPTWDTVINRTCDPYNCADVHYTIDGVSSGTESFPIDCP